MKGVEEIPVKATGRGDIFHPLPGLGAGEEGHTPTTGHRRQGLQRRELLFRAGKDPLHPRLGKTPLPSAVRLGEAEDDGPDPQRTSLVEEGREELQVRTERRSRPFPVEENRVEAEADPLGTVEGDQGTELFQGLRWGRNRGFYLPSPQTGDGEEEEEVLIPFHTSAKGEPVRQEGLEVFRPEGQRMNPPGVEVNGSETAERPPHFRSFCAQHPGELLRKPGRQIGPPGGGDDP